VQGGSFGYLPPTFSVIFNPSLQAIVGDNERFLETMQVLSGAILVVGIVQMALGYSGAIVPILKYLSPVTIAPIITAIGLGLYSVGFTNVSTCFSVGLIQMLLSIIFSQYLKKILIGGYPVFALFPIILAIAITWSFAAILTASDVWGEESACRTDSTRDLLDDMPWFRFPYPGQWGPLKFKSFAIVPMLGGMLAGMIESVGDCYSCAKLCGAPPPTPGIISRGLAGEGIGVVISGLFGAGAGTTSYSENIGAISLTRVGSRAVVQCGAVAMIIVGLFSKVAALFASLPSALVGGIYCVVFGLIVAVGLSNLQYVDLNSERNLFIIGFSIFNSLSIAGPAGYFAGQSENPFGDSNAGEIALALFSSPMIIALIAAFVLDNTIPGTPKERGLLAWAHVRDADVNNDPEYVKVYSLPLFFAKLFKNCGYLEYVSRGRMPNPPANGYQPGHGDIGELCCGGCFGGPPSLQDDVEEVAPQDSVVKQGDEENIATEA
jgi:nucleobase transporter 1/2